jgi:hypothetical protein
MVNEIFCYDNYFSDEDMAVIEEAVVKNLPGEDGIHPYGPFANQLMVHYVNLFNKNLKNTDLKQWFTTKLSPVFSKEFTIGSATRIKLFLPWDIHNDYYPDRCEDNSEPYYNILIPFDDVPSRTIIFDQFSTEYSDFSKYKDTHNPVPNPPSEEFWQENLSMCWPQDRQYVTVKKIMPWQRRGQLQGFPCQYFHSSDNFHTRFTGPKSFIQLRINAIK